MRGHAGFEKSLWEGEAVYFPTKPLGANDFAERLPDSKGDHFLARVGIMRRPP